MMEKIYSLRGNEINARGYLATDNQFVVIKNSNAIRRLQDRYEPLKRNMNLQGELLKNRVLVPSTDSTNLLVFQQEHHFNSPTQAADVILQRNVSGPQNWVNEKTGNSLKDERPELFNRKRKRLTKSVFKRIEKRHAFETKGWFRNSSISKRCKQLASYRCQACDLHFGESYGRIGEQFLEAHHKKPVSLRKSDRAAIGVNDLMALCPNCHRMIHRLLKHGEANEDNQLEILKERLRTKR